MIRAGGGLLEALASAVDAARADGVQKRAVADCPTCGGEGATGRRVYGRTAAEPVTYTTCGSCCGTGMVADDLVVHCGQPGCGAPMWADEACEHGMDSPLCAEHAPVGCVDCHGVRGDR